MRVLLLVLAACGSVGSPASARYDRCDAIKVKAAPDEVDAVKAIVVQRCTQDDWAVECKELDDCKLDDEQRKKLSVELDRVRSGLELAKLAELEAQMCACKSKACAAHVKTAWIDYERVHPPDRAAGERGKEIKKCEARATRENAIAAMTRFKNEMCQCADNACAMKVSDEMSKWAIDNQPKSDERMSDEDMKAATELGMEMAKCMAAAMGAGTP